MPFWRLFYHVVWATKGREPSLDPARQETVRRVVSTACRDIGVIVHAVGTMPDHVHVVASVPPAMALATAIGRWKGSAAHAINHGTGAGTEAPDRSIFVWQAEYGVLSCGERALPDVLAYVRDQPRRHAAGELLSALERTAPPAADGERTRGGMSRG